MPRNGRALPALDLPALYVAGYVPALAESYPDATSDMGVDFHAYCEVFLAGRWLTFDPRHNGPLRERVKIAHGLDAVATAIASIYGNVTAAQPNVWTRQTDLACAVAQPPAECLNPEH